MNRIGSKLKNTVNLEKQVEASFRWTEIRDRQKVHTKKLRVAGFIGHRRKFQKSMLYSS